MQVVVCGGGVIGCAAAYYLARIGAKVTLIERCRLGIGASGKSGGFLARDWCDGNPMSELARKSFDLHAELAGALPTDYGYRRMRTYLVAGGALARGVTAADSPAWLDGRSDVHQLLGDEQTTAQVEPLAFTEALFTGARTFGAKQVTATVIGVRKRRDGAIDAVQTDQGVFDTDAMLITLGPWTEFTRRWTALPKISASKGHSVVLRPARPLPADALFVEYPIDSQHRLSPEIMPRPNGEVYACGLPDYAALPEAPEAVDTNEQAAQILRGICADLSSALRDATLVGHQACYRPIAADALPIMGPVDGLPGAFVSTGHNCWGMLNAPASGLAMAELITGANPPVVDLTPFSPARPSLLT